MKNFDIEKLERKNIYSVPENFFEGMQENVLKRTVYSEEKIIPMSPQVSKKKSFGWVYAVAAAVALIFGGLFIFNQNNSQDSTIQDLDNQIATNIKNEQIKSDAEIAKVSEDEIQRQEDVVSQPAQNQLVTNKPRKATEAKQGKKLATQPMSRSVKSEMPNLVQTKREKTMSSEEKMDLILDTFSNEDIAVLAQNSLDDMYLDLYQ